MKILLREFDGMPYVWKTAKYDGERFVIDRRNIDESNIISVINDNRKNYIRCSSCGKIFPRNGKKFAKHKALASTIEPCLTCRGMCTKEFTNPNKRYIANDDGTYTLKTETIVSLVCNRGYWSDYKCNSTEAIMNCKFRQCESAKAEEITDIFIDYPGLFDQMITVDKLLDNGYKNTTWEDKYTREYIVDEDIGLVAHVNSLSIVDRFLVNNYKYCNYVYYSKKYDEFFGTDNGYGYNIWDPIDVTEENKDKVKELIRKIYK